jgi:hypothetical protein
MQAYVSLIVLECFMLFYVGYPPHVGCEDMASLSPSSYRFTVFGEISPISSSCASNLVEASTEFNVS